MIKIFQFDHIKKRDVSDVSKLLKEKNGKDHILRFSLIIRHNRKVSPFYRGTYNSFPNLLDFVEKIGARTFSGVTAVRVLLTCNLGGVLTAVITKGVSITGKALMKALRYNMLQKASQPVTNRTAGAAKKAFQQLNKYEPRNLPKNPDELLKRGYREITHPNAVKTGHREFLNPVTGQKIRFDQGKLGAPGHKGRNHYHYENQNLTSRHDEFLDINGNPCRDGSHQSHIYPGK